MHDWDQTALIACQLHNAHVTDAEDAWEIEDVHPLRKKRDPSERRRDEIIELPKAEAFDLFRKVFVGDQE